MAKPGIRTIGLAADEARGSLYTPLDRLRFRGRRFCLHHF
jgi:hypothetical protein